MSLTCSHCGNPNDRPSQRYCLQCHAIYMREHRAKQKREREQERDVLAAIRQRMRELSDLVTHVKPSRETPIRRG